MQRVAVVVLVLFGFLGQSVYLTSQTNVNQSDTPTIDSTTNTPDVSAAHITEPTAVPVKHKWKANVTHTRHRKIGYHLVPIAHLFCFPPPLSIAFGFLEARKYQSSYLS